MGQSLRDVYEDRFSEFDDEYRYDEQDEVVRSLAVTGCLLDLIFGGIEAPFAMAALKRIVEANLDRWAELKVAKDEIDRDWRTTWSEIDGSLVACEFLDELHNLHAFAYYGIQPIWGFVANEYQRDLPDAQHLRDRLQAVRDMPSWVEGVCQKIDQLERLVPRTPNGGANLGETLATRNIARARIKFDQGQPLTIHELAALSFVTPKRIQNAIYAKTDEAPVVDKNGLISPESCEAWLAGRDYRPSIWKQVAALYPLGPDWGEDVEFEATELDRTIDDYVFVPVANDHSMFVPSLRRSGKQSDGGYTIGAKGSEQVISDYDTALEQLRAMETPRWRRPNPESGNWGIVSGQTWKRVRRAELEGL